MRKWWRLDGSELSLAERLKSNVKLVERHHDESYGGVLAHTILSETSISYLHAY